MDATIASALMSIVWYVFTAQKQSPHKWSRLLYWECAESPLSDVNQVVFFLCSEPLMSGFLGAGMAMVKVIECSRRSKLFVNIGVFHYQCFNVFDNGVTG